jgi:hypothetical protein
MTLAKELRAKATTETKDVVVDCAGALQSDETINAITSAVHTPTGLTITGVATNNAILSEPGRRPIQPGQGIQAFIAGGTADTTYLITFTYTTSLGQTLEAAIKLRVTAPGS